MFIPLPIRQSRKNRIPVPVDNPRFAKAILMIPSWNRNKRKGRSRINRIISRIETGRKNTVQPLKTKKRGDFPPFVSLALGTVFILFHINLCVLSVLLCKIRVVDQEIEVAIIWNGLYSICE